MELPIKLSADRRTRQVGNFTSPKLGSVQGPLTGTRSLARPDAPPWPPGKPRNPAPSLDPMSQTAALFASAAVGAALTNWVVASAMQPSAPAILKSGFTGGLLRGSLAASYVDASLRRGWRELPQPSARSSQAY